MRIITLNTLAEKKNSFEHFGLCGGFQTHMSLLIQTQADTWLELPG